MVSKTIGEDQLIASDEIDAPNTPNTPDDQDAPDVPNAKDVPDEPDVPDAKDVPDEQDEEALFQAKLLKVCDLLQANPLNRAMMCKILKACMSERQVLNKLEEYIQEQPEFKSITQPPYYLIKWLLENEALNIIELDQEGNVITPEQKEGKSEDEIEDLIEDVAFITNEVGRMAALEFSPANRLMPLLEAKPDRYDTYIELLEFLKEPRSYNEVDKLLRGRDVLMSGRTGDERPIQPSVFIDKLAQSGSINFIDGWVITEEGKELLDMILEEKK